MYCHFVSTQHKIFCSLCYHDIKVLAKLFYVLLLVFIDFFERVYGFTSIVFAPSSFVTDFDSADGQNNGYNEEK